MSRIYDDLQNQLNTEYKKEAEDCIKIYNKVKELSGGSVWSSDWHVLTTIAGFFPASNDIVPNRMALKPSAIGEIFLKGIYAKPIIPRSKGWRRN